MEFSALERPKLPNAKSLKFYPEDYNQHVSFRHKQLPPDFEMNINSYMSGVDKQRFRDISVRPQISNNRKCPIYVHNLGKGTRQNNYEGDHVKNKQKKSMLEKLEESYWANWKPDKKDNVFHLKPNRPSDVQKIKHGKSPEIQVIKSAPASRRRKIKVFPRPEEIASPDVPTQIENDFKVQKTQQIQTECSSSSTKLKESENKESTEDILADTKFLKHTDSFILLSKKQKEDKEHFEQPKCIRLYKKPGKPVSRNFIKGGSYPLKSCLKKESNLTKGNIRLGRPGSPIIVSSNLNKHKHHKR